MRLRQITRVLLDEDSSPGALEAALDAYVRICAEVTGITPDAGFGAWAQDRFLDDGIAINPAAAANCVTDYRRTVVFVRSVHAALTRLLDARPGAGLRVLYAGCGPWATLLLPVLGEFPAERLRVRLLDVHASALDALDRLVHHFALGDRPITTELADACRYVCPEAPDLIIVEAMHKALEQEPQFAVTAKLAPQLAPGGIFLPERIDVDLSIAQEGARRTLGRVLSLSAATLDVPAPVDLTVPADGGSAATCVELITSIRVFESHCLAPGEAHITLPRPCPGLLPLAGGARLRVEYRCGSFPAFEVSRQVTPPPNP